MSKFTVKELDYIGMQKLGRLATVTPDGKPQIAPVVFEYNPELDTIDIRGANLSKSKKFRNSLKTPNVAFVIDDVLPPWRPCGVEIRGTAQAIEAIDAHGNPLGKPLIHITADQIIGWGLDDPDPYVTNTTAASSGNPHVRLDRVHSGGCSASLQCNEGKITRPLWRSNLAFASICVSSDPLSQRLEVSRHWLRRKQQQFQAAHR